MTNHVVSDELFTGEFAAVRDAYRVGEGNSTMRAECENQVCCSCCVPGMFFSPDSPCRLA